MLRVSIYSVKKVLVTYTRLTFSNSQELRKLKRINIKRNNTNDNYYDDYTRPIQSSTLCSYAIRYPSDLFSRCCIFMLIWSVYLPPLSYMTQRRYKKNEEMHILIDISEE